MCDGIYFRNRFTCFFLLFLTCAFIHTFIVKSFTFRMRKRNARSRKLRELFTRTFPVCAFFLCNKKKSGFPNSMTGTHNAAIMTQASWRVVWPGNIYSEQPSRTWLWPRSIILINVINIDGAQPGVYAMSIKHGEISLNFVWSKNWIN